MRILFATALLACIAACAGPPRAAKDDSAAAVAALLQGSYDSRDQAARDKDYRAVVLTVMPVLAGRDDGHWLYVEQAIADLPDKPYGQRVYRLYDGDNGEVLAEVHAIDDPVRFVQGWRNGALKTLTHDALRPLPGCTLHLRKVGDGWRGATRGKDCDTDREGAAYAAAEVEIDAKGLRSWDRGFSATGKRVWGPARGAYVFVKRGAVR